MKVNAFTFFQDTLPIVLPHYFLGGGPKKNPKSNDDDLLEEAMAQAEATRISIAAQASRPMETLNIGSEEFSINRVSGQDQNCFFHALAGAGIYMDRSAAIEILRQVETHEERQWIYNEVWQLREEGYFIPSSSLLDGDDLINDFLFNYLGAPENEQGFHMIGFSTDFPGIIDVLANAIGIRIRVVQQDALGSAAIIRETIPNSDRPNVRVVTLLHHGLHFDLLQTAADIDYLQRFPPYFEGFSVISPEKAERYDIVMSTIISLLDAARDYIGPSEGHQMHFSILNREFEKLMNANSRFRYCNTRLIVPYVETMVLRIRLLSCDYRREDPEPLRLILRTMREGFNIHPNFQRVIDLKAKGHRLFFKQLDSLSRATKLVGHKLLANEGLMKELRNELLLLQGNEKTEFPYAELKEYAIGLANLGILCDQAEDILRIRQQELSLLHRQEQVARLEAETRLKQSRHQASLDKQSQLELERTAKLQEKQNLKRAQEAKEQELASQRHAKREETLELREQRAKELAEQREQKQQFESIIAWALQNRAIANRLAASSQMYHTLPLFDRALLVEAGDPDWNAIYREIERIGGSVLLNSRGNNRHLLMWSGADGTMISYFFDAIHGAQDSMGRSCGAIRGLLKRLSETARLYID